MTAAKAQIQPMDAHPRGKDGRVVDVRQDFGADPTELRKAFDFYFEAFPGDEGSGEVGLREAPNARPSG